MKRKKILWLSHLIPYPPKGGVLQRSFYLIKELSKYHEVHLIALNQTPLLNLHFESPNEGITISQKKLEEFCASVKIGNNTIPSTPLAKASRAFRSLFSRTGYTVDWLITKDLPSLIKELINSQNIDYIHCDTISLCAYKKYFKNIPYTVGHHNIESHMMLRRSQNEQNLLKKAYFFQEYKKLRRFESINCEAAHFNYTCSQLDSDRLKKICPTAKIKAIPNGVDLTYFRGHSKSLKISKIITFIFAGRLNAYTNKKAAEELVLEIWPQLKKSFPYSKLVIAGSSPSRVLVDISNNDPALTVTGYVEDIRPFLKEATIYICPIKDGGGTKLKVLDALAMGVPLISHPVACEGISVTPGENVLFASDTKDYVEHVTNLTSDPALYEMMSRSGIRLVEKDYSYVSIGQTFAESF